VTDPKIAVVIATNRPESMARWFAAWREQLHDTRIYVIEDNPILSMPAYEGYSDVKRHCWHSIDKALGENAWIIPRRTSAIKSFGFWKAYQDGYENIWTLDDDCLPEPGREYPYPGAVQSVLRRGMNDDSWFNTIESTGLYPRGYPYGIRQNIQPVKVHHGLWSGVPDLDGITALEHRELRLDPAAGVNRVPAGKMFPMCGMNLAFHRDMTPAMYFGLQGHRRRGVKSPVKGEFPLDPLPFDRFDDIWAGLFAKRVCDHLGWAVTTGAPSIVHTKESDPTMRVIKEAPGIAVNEKLWRWVAKTPVEGTTASYVYAGLAESLVDFARQDEDRKDYWTLLARAMRTWTEICR
jgi:hypothetical protein